MNQVLRLATLLTLAYLTFTATQAHASTAVHTNPADSPRSFTNSFADIGQTFRLAVGKMKQGDARGAEEDLTALVTNPRLAAAGPRFSFAVHTALAYCQQGNHEFELAYENALAAGEIAPAVRNRDYWYLLMSAARATHRDYVAVESLAHVLLSSPEHANDVDVSTIWSAYDTTASMNDGGAHRKLLLEALWQVKYVPKDAFELPATQRWWTDLYESYIDAGDAKSAQAVLGAIHDPYQVLRLRADNRYRESILRDARVSDIVAVQQDDIRWLNGEMQARPRLIGLVEKTARALMMSNRLSETLQLLDDALANVAKAPKGKPAFDDLSDNLRWVSDTRARVLARMGRWDAALDAQQAAQSDAAVPADDVVSQRINFGDYLYRLNRPREALEQVKTVNTENASAYGMMEAGEVRACAFAQLGDRTRLRATIDAMLEQRDVDADALRIALLCADDESQIAKIITARLRNERTRNAELAADQEYLPTPNPTPYDRTLSLRLRHVLGRPDVHAAINEYGVVEHYPMFAPDD
ncbi:hypothetical protein C0Z18_31300 [Trinickia dabaoshanensis]|uniref:Tetratricopeptide repeat-containing protein n=1 Tax=Trinickia dabaoshanensis TaxID=564714 RepID=A0A2N7VBK6_9BURK|nr:hypothetical protein [Trinickia dabaoshanensis]PMS14525.1 hypothetical protein C0Z18_31300 [Trinickia dabaoshanensis]